MTKNRRIPLVVLARSADNEPPAFSIKEVHIMLQEISRDTDCRRVSGGAIAVITDVNDYYTPTDVYGYISSDTYGYDVLFNGTWGTDDMVDPANYIAVPGGQGYDYFLVQHTQSQYDFQAQIDFTNSDSGVTSSFHAIDQYIQEGYNFGTMTPVYDGGGVLAYFDNGVSCFEPSYFSDNSLATLVDWGYLSSSSYFDIWAGSDDYWSWSYSWDPYYC